MFIGPQNLSREPEASHGLVLDLGEHVRALNYQRENVDKGEL